MAWFLVKCQGVTFDASRSFPTGSFAYSEGESPEERAQVWGLKKADPKERLPDLYYPEELTAGEMAKRDLTGQPTHGYTIELSAPPPPEAWVCRNGLLCVIPITIGKRE